MLGGNSDATKITRAVRAAVCMRSLGPRFECERAAAHPVTTRSTGHSREPSARVGSKTMGRIQSALSEHSRQERRTYRN